MRLKPTILIVGQASQKTGLARVTAGMADHLAHDYDMHVLGIDCFDPGAAGRAEGGWMLHHNPELEDMFAELRLATLVDEIRPEIVVLYNDLGVIDRYFARLEQAAHQSRLIGYCPIDGNIVFTDLVSSLAPLDKLVVFTEFARNAVHACANRLGLAQQAPFDSVRAIAHGLDEEAFHPWPHGVASNASRRLAARQALFPERPALWEGFWVLNANRNQPRKRIDLTMEGFALFAADKPAHVRLYLHTGLKEIGIDILQYARILGISERLVLTHGDENHPGSSTGKLNTIYNACDVGVNSATGEGWGLISCEHAATRAAQVVPRHSACAEIWEGAAEMLAPVAAFSTGLLEGQRISSGDLAAALERFYADSAYCDRMAQAAYERATDPALGWRNVAAQWGSLFEEMRKMSAA